MKSRRALLAAIVLSFLFSSSAALAQEGGPSVDETLAYINNLTRKDQFYRRWVVDGGRLCFLTTNNLVRPPATDTECAYLSDLAVNKIGLSQRNDDYGPSDVVTIGCSPASLSARRECWEVHTPGAIGLNTVYVDREDVICSKMGNCYNAFVHLLRMLNVKETGIEDPFK
jgi:hypothetical protein